MILFLVCNNTKITVTITNLVITTSVTDIAENYIPKPNGCLTQAARSLERKGDKDWSKQPQFLHLNSSAGESISHIRWRSEWEAQVSLEEKILPPGGRRPGSETHVLLLRFKVQKNWWTEIECAVILFWRNIDFINGDKVYLALSNLLVHFVGFFFEREFGACTNHDILQLCIEFLFVRKTNSILRCRCISGG